MILSPVFLWSGRFCFGLRFGFGAGAGREVLVVRIGGALLIVVGAALLFGFWDDAVIWIRGEFGLGGVTL